MFGDLAKSLGLMGWQSNDNAPQQASPQKDYFANLRPPRAQQPQGQNGLSPMPQGGFPGGNPEPDFQFGGQPDLSFMDLPQFQAPPQRDRFANLRPPMRQQAPPQRPMLGPPQMPQGQMPSFGDVGGFPSQRPMLGPPQMPQGQMPSFGSQSPFLQMPSQPMPQFGGQPNPFQQFQFPSWLMSLFGGMY
jgi:hypothetical protein